METPQHSLTRFGGETLSITWLARALAQWKLSEGHFLLVLVMRLELCWHGVGSPHISRVYCGKFPRGETGRAGAGQEPQELCMRQGQTLALELEGALGSNPTLPHCLPLTRTTNK